MPKERWKSAKRKDRDHLTHKGALSIQHSMKAPKMIDDKGNDLLDIVIKFQKFHVKNPKEHFMLSLIVPDILEVR